MTTAATYGGIQIRWGAEHRTGSGDLVVRMVSLSEPPPLTCTDFRCIIKWVKDMYLYSLIELYHERRVAYAEKNRGKYILERYRTGDPSPKNLLQVAIALTKLTCPVCRKVETPW